MTVPGAGTEGTMAHEHDWGPEGFCRDVGCAASAAETVRDFRAEIARLVEFGGKLTRAKDAEIARLTHDNGVLRLSRDGEIGARKLAEDRALVEAARGVAGSETIQQYVGGGFWYVIPQADMLALRAALLSPTPAAPPMECARKGGSGMCYCPECGGPPTPVAP